MVSEIAFRARKVSGTFEKLQNSAVTLCKFSCNLSRNARYVTLCNVSCDVSRNGVARQVALNIAQCDSAFTLISAHISNSKYTSSDRAVNQFPRQTMQPLLSLFGLCFFYCIDSWLCCFTKPITFSLWRKNLE